MTYSVYPISVGEMTIDKSINTYMENIGQKYDQHIYMWLIKGGGRTIVVDTGPPPPEHCRRYQREIRQSSEQQPENALRRNGVDPRDVDVVIMTHLHWDHCGNNDLFPNARFHVQKRELVYAVDPLPVHRKGYQAPTFAPLPKPLWIGFPYEAVDGDCQLMPGIRLLSTPGHSPGCQAVLVEGEESGTIAIAGDTFPTFDNFENPDKLVPSAIHVNLSDYYRSMERLLNEADVILPGHDPRVLQQPYYT